MIHEESSINGVSTQGLKEMIRAIKDDPDLAKSRFKIENTWVLGGYNKTETKNYYAAGKEHTRAVPFRFEADEPPPLLGHDKGANPVEYLLAALSGCMTTTTIYHAAVKGITIEALESTFEGELDLHGFLDLAEGVPKGYQKIRAHFKVKCDADLSDISHLYKHSPVCSMISCAVPIEVTMEKIEDSQ